MKGMDVDLEIHAPGLDLHHERWNYHVLFMDEVHAYCERIAALGWDSYQRVGRGTIFVDRKLWMTIIKARWDRDKLLFPCEYVADGLNLPDSKFSALRSGFLQMVEDYDPNKQFVMCVEHHSANLFSSYLLRTSPGPPEAYQRYFEED